MTTVTFAGSGDAFGSGGRFQAGIHLRPEANQAPVLLDCGATSRRPIYLISANLSGHLALGTSYR